MKRAFALTADLTWRETAAKLVSVRLTTLLRKSLIFASRPMNLSAARDLSICVGKRIKKVFKNAFNIARTVQHSQNIYSVIQRQVKDKIAFDNETSQTHQKLVLFTSDKWIITQKDKFVFDFLDEFAGGIFIVLREIIPNVFQIFGSRGRNFDNSLIIFLKRHVFLLLVG